MVAAGRSLCRTRWLDAFALRDARRLCAVWQLQYHSHTITESPVQYLQRETDGYKSSFCQPVTRQKLADKEAKYNFTFSKPPSMLYFVKLQRLMD